MGPAAHARPGQADRPRGSGFDDELYFSRLFKRATGFSPTFFREYETAIRGGSNLSMPPPLPSIPREPRPGA